MKGRPTHYSGRVRYIPFLLELALLVFALVECIQSDEQDRAGLPQILWIILIVLVPIAGPLAWLLVSRARRSIRRPEPGWGPVIQPAPVAPDDDPEFLWRLESEHRRAAKRSAPTPPPARADGHGSTPGSNQTVEPGPVPGGPDAPDPGDVAT